MWRIAVFKMEVVNVYLADNQLKSKLINIKSKSGKKWEILETFI